MDIKTAIMNDDTVADIALETPAVEIDHLSLFYGAKQALFDISMKIAEHRVTAFIGPSGCGKSTLLRCLNRMNDLIDGIRIEGAIRIHGFDVRDPSTRHHRAAQARGHGLPEVEPLPEEHLRERGLWAAHPARPAGACWTPSWRRACAPPPCGTRSRTACRRARSACRAASSSASASPARMAWNRRCC
jgi:energy-coupling factor transporter ATP-binding protein EcfA2